MNLKHEEHIQHSFDSYCKKILKYTARTHYDKLRKRAGRETVFSELPYQEQSKLTGADKYFTNEYAFKVLGEDVCVSNYDLANALNTLPADNLEIILLSYFFDMADKEISKLLHMTRRTVAYRRKCSLRDLKRHLESED